MSPEAQRMAIAKACGWLEIDDIFKTGVPPVSEPTLSKMYGGKQPVPNNWTPCDDVPDYVNDLNAMHEAENTLAHLEFERYEIQLSRHTAGVRRPISATAAQRAEAFLRVMGLWRDEP